MQTDETRPADQASSQSIALVVGATGMVGSELCRQLRDDPRFSPVVVLARREPPVTGPPLQVELVDFARIGEWNPGVPIDTVFCALGTTIRPCSWLPSGRPEADDSVNDTAGMPQRVDSRAYV